MKKFMVVILVDGEEFAKFFDTRDETETYRVNCECCVGGYAEVYMRIKHEYKLMY